MSYVFISYSKRESNEKYAFELAKFLQNKGFDTWIDRSDINYGVNWWDAIVAGIEKCGAFVVIMTPEAAASEWVKLETYLAVKWGKPILPLLLNGEVFPLLALKQYADVRNGRMPTDDAWVKQLAQHVTPRTLTGGADRSNLTADAFLQQDTNFDVYKAIADFHKVAEHESWRTALEILGRIRASRQRIPTSFDINDHERRIHAAIQREEAAKNKPLDVPKQQLLQPRPSKSYQSASSLPKSELVASPRSPSQPTPRPKQPTQRAESNSSWRRIWEGLFITVVGGVILAVVLGQVDIKLPKVSLSNLFDSSKEKHNADWTPIIQEFDGVEMVNVPEGCFMMGSTTYDDEQPVHEICFDEPFWIDRYEVTNAQFAAFNGQAGRESNWTDDNLPRESITWFEARDFCELRGGRLPTEAEWEYAARGPDGLVYPWGDDFDGTLLNFCDTNCSYEWADKTVDDGYGNTAPVGSYDLGVSWVGAMDMSGNVWEWTSSIYQSYPYKSDDGREDIDNTNNSRVFRGGSWGCFDNLTRVAYRFGNDPNDEVSYVGLRCVRSR